GVAVAEMTGEFAEHDLLAGVGTGQAVARAVLDFLVFGIDDADEGTPVVVEAGKAGGAALVAAGVGEVSIFQQRADIAAGLEQVLGVLGDEANGPAERAGTVGGVADAGLHLDAFEQVGLNGDATGVVEEGAR